MWHVPRVIRHLERSNVKCQNSKQSKVKNLELEILHYQTILCDETNEEKENRLLKSQR